MYEMADERALVLWECVFPDGMLEWVGAEREDLVDGVWALWHRARVDEVLTGGLLDVITGAVEGGAGEGMPGGVGEFEVSDVARAVEGRRKGGRSQVIVEGGDKPVYRGRYVPVLERRRMEDVEVINRRYVEKKGDWAENRNRRVEARKARVRVREEVVGDGGEEVE